MNIFDAMRKRRSIRRFKTGSVSLECLKEIVEVSRLYPSGGNVQPIRFGLVSEKELADSIFNILGWAMYLPDYKIEENERPCAYIVLLRDGNVSAECDYDVGAASAMVMLAAVEKGLATCPIGNFNSEKLVSLLGLSDNLRPELVIAIGYPAQESYVVPMGDTVRYTQDNADNFLVPKWNTEDVIVFNK